MWTTKSYTNRFILTGTPGSGKTSVINLLEDLGYCVIHEAATDLIQIKQELGLLEPWKENSFIDDIVMMQKERQIRAQGELQFYDRSPFCTYALGEYLAFSQNKEFQPSQVLLSEINQCIDQQFFQKKIFFFENLGFIKESNARKISYKEALIFERIHKDVYEKFGFEFLFIPKDLNVSKRSELILEHSLKGVKEDYK